MQLLADRFTAHHPDACLLMGLTTGEIEKQAILYT
jgi:hypothetical protein